MASGAFWSAGCSTGSWSTVTGSRGHTSTSGCGERRVTRAAAQSVGTCEAQRGLCQRQSPGHPLWAAPPPGGARRPNHTVYLRSALCPTFQDSFSFTLRILFARATKGATSWRSQTQGTRRPAGPAARGRCSTVRVDGPRVCKVFARLPPEPAPVSSGQTRVSECT